MQVGILDFWSEIICFDCLGPINKGRNISIQKKRIKHFVTIVIKETDSLETRAELAVLRTYVENQATPEPILL